MPFDFMDKAGKSVPEIQTRQHFPALPGRRLDQFIYIWEKQQSEILFLLFVYLFLNELLLEIIAVHFPFNVCGALNAACMSRLQLLEPVILLQTQACSCNEFQVLCL